jgi:hypothetical protein
MNTKFQLENLSTRDHLGDTGVDGKAILKQILQKQCNNVDWIHLA